MKNPFVMMALMAAVMSDAFRENKYRDAGIALPLGSSTRSRMQGKKQPAGTKQVMRFYRAKHGVKATSAEEAREWYANYNPHPVAKAELRRAPRLPMKLAA